MVFRDYLQPKVSGTGCCFQGGRPGAASPCGDLALRGQAACRVSHRGAQLRSNEWPVARVRACFRFVDLENARRLECSPECALLCVSLWKCLVRSGWPRRRRRPDARGAQVGPDDVRLTAPWVADGPVCAGSCQLDLWGHEPLSQVPTLDFSGKCHRAHSKYCPSPKDGLHHLLLSLWHILALRWQQAYKSVIPRSGSRSGQEAPTPRA